MYQALFLLHRCYMPHPLPVKHARMLLGNRRIVSLCYPRHHKRVQQRKGLILLILGSLMSLLPLLRPIS
jgi:hypothetical protein